MPPTAAATTSRSVASVDIARDLTRQSTETDFVPTLLACGRSIEELGFRAEPRFTRDDAGRIAGVEVHGVSEPDETTLLGRRAGR